MAHLADKLYEKRWGVFNHFLYGNPGGSSETSTAEYDWNKRVEELDTEKIAFQLNELGAGYYFITLMQGRKFMLAPNETFDRIAGTKPGEACATRDLVADLYRDLSKYAIDLYLYYTGDGPYQDMEVGKHFGFIEPRKKVSMAFVQNWAAVMEEYSIRYGEKVCGWWIDGCYDYFGYDNTLLEPYYKAAKVGNPNALVAFNNGVKETLVKWYPEEEFTAGEFNDFTCIPPERFIDGAQAHMLAPLGYSTDGNIWGGWGKPNAKCDHAYMRDYINKANAAGGVVTVDIAVIPDGSFSAEQMDVLRGI